MPWATVLNPPLLCCRSKRLQGATHPRSPTPSSAAIQRRSWHSDDSPVHPGHPRLPRQASAFLGCAEHSEAVMPHLGCLGLLASGRDGCPLCAGTSPDTSWLPMRSTQAWADPCVHDSTGHCCLGCAERGHHWWPVQCILGCPAGPRPTRLRRTEPREAKAVLPRLRHGEGAAACHYFHAPPILPNPCCLALRRHRVHAVAGHAPAAQPMHPCGSVAVHAQAAVTGHYRAGLSDRSNPLLSATLLPVHIQTQLDIPEQDAAGLPRQGWPRLGNPPKTLPSRSRLPLLGNPSRS